MPRNFNNQLAGQIGESLVVAELGGRVIVATARADKRLFFVGLYVGLTA